MNISHRLPTEDLIEHEESMDCLCEPYAADVVYLGPRDGSVVIVAHRSFRVGLDFESA